MKIRPSAIARVIIICTVVLSVSTFVNAAPAHSLFPQCNDLPFFPELERNAGLLHPDMRIPKIGGITESHNLIWGESVGWVNIKTKPAELKIGSNILAGWVWMENCGWVCFGEGHPLHGGRYSNRGAHDWGVNNDGHGMLSGYAWSEITGWISLRTNHSRVYLDETGRFCGYAWGENVGWMHFGPGWTVQYLAKAEPGPWKKIGQESEGKFACSPDDSEMSSCSVPVTGLKINHERYDDDADSVCVLRSGRDNSCAHIRCCDTPVYISSLVKLSPIRAPPHCG